MGQCALAGGELHQESSQIKKHSYLHNVTCNPANSAIRQMTFWSIVEFRVQKCVHFMCRDLLNGVLGDVRITNIILNYCDIIRYIAQKLIKNADFGDLRTRRSGVRIP